MGSLSRKRRFKRFFFFVFLSEVEGHARNSTKQIDNLCVRRTAVRLYNKIFVKIFCAFVPLWQKKFSGKKQKKPPNFSSGFLYFLYSLFYSQEKNYTLKRKCITSPSFTTYSFPSTLNFPASFAFASEPY